MIGIAFFGALALLYGAAYTIHSLRKHAVAAAVVSSVLGGVRAGFLALLFWMRLR